MKKIFLTAAMATAMFTGAHAASVSGTTNFKVTIPEILVLYHWDEAHLTLTGDTFNKKDIKDHKKTQEFSLTIATIDQNQVDTTWVPDTLDGTKIAVTLKDSWAVRAITSQTNVTMAIETQKKDHILDGTDTSSKAVVSDAELSMTSIPTSWTPMSGNITFNLDLSGVTKAGVHMTAAIREPATDTFKLTLTGAP